MRIHNHGSRIAHPDCMTNRRKWISQLAALVFALAAMTAGYALPPQGQLHHAYNRPITSIGMNRGRTLTGALKTPRYAHTATLLNNGEVLLAGGAIGAFCLCCCGPDPSSTSIALAELYDPATETFSYTGSLNTARLGHTATLLQSGEVLVTGGYAGIIEDTTWEFPLTSAELYDPATGLWRPTGSFRTIQGSNCTTLLPNGKVLAVSGSSAELYDPVTETWSNTGSPNFAGVLTPSMTLLPNSKVLAVSGSSAGLYDPATETWSSAANLKVIRFAPHTMTLLGNGKVLVTGSYTSSLGPRFAELYNPDSGKWSITGRLSAVRWDSEHFTATLLPDGRVLASGGYPSDPSFIGDELYDPATGRWGYTSRLIYARDNYHTATLLTNGRVLVVGGVDKPGADGQNFPHELAELYDPNPRVTSASVSGKKLIVNGENFDHGAVILINGEGQTTKNDQKRPKRRLIGKESGKKIQPGDKLQVRNPNGSISPEFTFTGPGDRLQVRNPNGALSGEFTFPSY